MRKRSLAFFLVIIMMIQLLPVNAFAEEPIPAEDMVPAVSANDSVAEESTDLVSEEDVTTVTEYSLGNGGRKEIEAKTGDTIRLKYSDMTGDIYEWTGKRHNGTNWNGSANGYLKIEGGRSTATVKILSAGRLLVDYTTRIDLGVEDTHGEAQWFITATGDPVGGTVTFYPNGGSCTQKTKYVYFDSAYGTLPVASRTGYVFAGWYTAATEGTRITEDTIVSIRGDHALYAHWDEEPSYNVTLDPSGGTVKPSSIRLKVDGNYENLPVPVKGDSIFMGWYTEGGVKKDETDKYSLSDGNKLIAKWADEISGYSGKQYYSVKGTTLTISGNGPSVSYNSAEETPWYPYADGIREIVVKEGVTTIGDNMFGELKNVEDISLPSTLDYIGEYAFYKCKKLKSVKGGKSLRMICTRAFSQCTRLYSIDFSEGLQIIGKYAFANCTNLRYVNLSDNLTTLKYGAFYYCPLDTIALPDTVETIEKSALGNHSITKFYIPAGITRIEDEQDIFGPYGRDFLGDFQVEELGFSNLTYLGHIRYGENPPSWLKLYAGCEFSTYYSSEYKLNVHHLEENEEFAIFHPNGGLTTEAFTVVTRGGKYPELPNEWVTLREGYEFDGWYTERKGGERILEGDTVSANGNHRLYAHWTKIPDSDDPDDPTDPDDPVDPLNPIKPLPRFTVRFFSGDELVYSEKVVSGNTVSKVPEATGDGVFTGWYTMDTNTLWNETMPIFRNLDLKAVFITNGVYEKPSGSGLDPEVDLSGSEVYLVKGQTCEMNSQESWTSDNPSVVKVSKGFRITAVQSGTATLRGSGGRVVSVTVAAPFLTKSKTLMIGESEVLELKGLEKTGDHYPVTWLSDSPGVVSVEDGLIFAVGKGKTKVSAYVNGKAFTCKVTVKETGTPDSFEGAVRVAPLQTIRIKYKDGFKVKKAKWTSTKSMSAVTTGKGTVKYYCDDVVKITPSGKLTAIGSGVTTLTAENNGQKKTFTVVVQSTGQTKYFLNKGKIKGLRYYKVKSGGKNAAKWESSDPSVVTVDPKGKLKGVNPGKAVVTCSYNPYNTANGFLYSTVVYVEDPEITDYGGMTLSKGRHTLNMNVGHRYAIRLKDVYQNVVFRSSSVKKAFVDESGVVYARGKGKVKLTVKVNGKKLVIGVVIK